MGEITLCQWIRRGALWCVLALCIQVRPAYVEERVEPISPLVSVRSFEGGHLYRAGLFSVLQLNGSWRQMGRQYGALMADDLRAMHDEIVRQYTKNVSAPGGESLQSFCTRLFRLYPTRFQALAQGMADTSTLDMTQISVLNEFFDYFLWTTSPELTQCSCLAAWGSYTNGGPLVLARNFDFPGFFRAFDPYLTVVVYNPSQESHSAAVITYAGQIGAIQAFNDSGLVLENNNGSIGADSSRYFGERIPFLINDLTMLLDHGTFAGLDAALKTARLHQPLIFNVADPSGAWCYEMSTSEVRRRQGLSDGLLVAANHFIAPGWPPPPASYREALEYSLLRHANLGRLAEQHKGTITARTMMGILDVQVEAGGATPGDRSIYQFVAVPAQRTLYLKAAGYADWRGIDLGALFHS